MANELANEIIRMSRQLGVSPLDVATSISYETGGTFDPLKRGPHTQWGQHRGLFQAGEPQARKYFNNDFSIPSQIQGMGRYLKDTGVRPGMGLMDIYSAINAGGVGRYDRSDAHNGGAPGTVADKVNNQMGAHRQKAIALLGGQFTPPGAPTSALAGMMAPTTTGAPQMFGDLIGQNKVATTSVGPMDFGTVAANLLNSAQERDARKADIDAAETARRVALFGGADGSGLWGLYA